MLRVLSDSGPDGVNKSLGLAQAFGKERLESLLGDKNVSLVFYITMLLLPSE